MQHQTQPPSLETILARHPNVWRIRDRAYAAHVAHGSLRATGINTHYSALNQALPNQGWPSNQLVELLLPAHGIGELNLVLPGLSELLTDNLWLAWINPPYIPYAPALIKHAHIVQKSLWIRTQTEKETLWSLEQCLHSSACGAVLFWAAPNISYSQLRRLSLAAKTGHTLGFAFRHLKTQHTSSPAPIRLALTKTKQSAITPSMNLKFIKCPGRWQQQPIQVPTQKNHATGAL